MSGVYHLTSGSLAWSYADRYTAPAAIVTPPEYVVRKHGDSLDRLDDDDGKIPNDVLRQLSYSDLRAIAAASDYDEITGNSSTEAIIDTLGKSTDTDRDDDVDAMDAEPSLPDASPPEVTDTATASPEPTPDGISREKAAIEALRREDEIDSSGTED